MNKWFCQERFRKMYASAISPYRNNLQTFTGEKISRRIFLKILSTVTIGIVVAQSIMAQNTTGTVTNTKTYYFKELTKDFWITNYEKATVTVANTKGKTDGYDLLRILIKNAKTDETTKWWVTGLLEPGKGWIKKNKWVVLGDFDLLKGIDNKIEPLHIEKIDFVNYIEELLVDTRNLTGIKLEKVDKKQIDRNVNIDVN